MLKWNGSTPTQIDTRGGGLMSATPGEYKIRYVVLYIRKYKIYTRKPNSIADVFLPM